MKTYLYFQVSGAPWELLDFSLKQEWVPPMMGASEVKGTLPECIPFVYYMLVLVHVCIN